MGTPVSAPSCDMDYNRALQSSSHVTFSHLVMRQPGQLWFSLQMRKQSQLEAKRLSQSDMAIKVQKWGMDTGLLCLKSLVFQFPL